LDINQKGGTMPNEGNIPNVCTYIPNKLISERGFILKKRTPFKHLARAKADDDDVRKFPGH